MTEQSDGEKKQPPEQLEFHFIKSNHFRVIYADGAYGAVTPKGMIHFALYNERRAIPKRSARTLAHSDGDIIAYGPEKEADKLEGIVREVEVEVFLDINTAADLCRWLERRIDEAQRNQIEIAAQISKENA